MQRTIIDKKVKVYTIDALKIAGELGLGMRINSIMQACFFKISGVLPEDEAISLIKKAIKKTYGRKGEEVVKMNWDAVDRAAAALRGRARPGRRSPSPRRSSRSSPTTPALTPGRSSTRSRGSRATCCPSPRCPSTGPSRRPRPAWRSAASPPSARTGSPRTASSATSAPSSAPTPPSGPSRSRPPTSPARPRGSSPSSPTPGTTAACNTASRSTSRTASAAATASRSARPRPRPWS